MTRRNTWMLGIALAGVLVLAGVAVSQPAQPTPAGAAATAMAQPAAMPDLTPEQAQKMDDLKVKYLREMQPLRTDLQVKQVELAALWRAEELDANKIIAKVKEISDVRGKLQLARVNHRLAMYKLLTPRQRRHARMSMRGMGMGCGMRGMGEGRGMGRTGMMGPGMQGMGQMGNAGGCPGMGTGMMGGQGDMCPQCPMHGMSPTPPNTPMPGSD